MREQNNKRSKGASQLNQNSDAVNQQLNTSMKGIHPDERPIKAASSYNFDEVPVGSGSNKNDSKPKSTFAQSKVAATKTQESNGGGVMMTFDFSDPVPKPAKKSFLKRKTEKPKVVEDSPVKEEDQKKVEEVKITKKSTFLKKGEKLVYDPLKAVKEAKQKKKKEIVDKELEKEIENEKEKVNFNGKLTNTKF